MKLLPGHLLVLVMSYVIHQVFVCDRRAQVRVQLEGLRQGVPPLGQPARTLPPPHQREADQVRPLRLHVPTDECPAVPREE